MSSAKGIHHEDVAQGRHVPRGASSSFFTRIPARFPATRLTGCDFDTVEPVADERQLTAQQGR